MRCNYIFLLILCGLIAFDQGYAQSINTPGDYLSSDFHKQRREALRSQLPDHSVAVFFANAKRNRSNDIDYVYHQDPNFYYFTGYKEPDAVLLIFKEDQTMKDGTLYHEIIFVRPRNPKNEMWTGRRLGVEGVHSKLDIQQVFDNHKFENYHIDFKKFKKILFYDFYNDVRDDKKDNGDLFDLIRQFKTDVHYPSSSNPDLTVEPVPQNLDVQSLKRIMADLRGIKTPEEIKLLTKAVAISTIAQNEVMKALKPGMSEAEIQGIQEFVFKKYGSEYEGYPSIVGAGNNGCILHYIDNQKPSVSSKEMVLMDLGAEYHGYSADVTRTIPVKGTFSKEQKAIYDLVYDAQESAIRASIAGTKWRTTRLLARKIIYQGLVDLGILDSIDQPNSYYPHGLGHHIGLDVHDAGNYDVFEPGMVFTVEPGIYIPDGSPCDNKWWGIAVRIEDCVLIGEDGQPHLLSYRAPRKSEDIERMMARPSALDDFVLPDLEGN